MPTEIEVRGVSTTDLPGEPIAEDSSTVLLPDTERELEREISDALAGKSAVEGVNKDELKKLCRVVEYWLDDDTTNLIDGLGLIPLAREIKRDYVLASLLSWRGEYKLAYITIRSFLESFCLLLYYLNQGCDRLLYLKGKGYKLMLHRMAQKRPVADDMHAFRRHYHLLIEESYGSAKAADRFFEELDDCYSMLSKAVHGDYATSDNNVAKAKFLDTLKRVLRICNTLALHDPMLDATEDDLNDRLALILSPNTFEWKPK